MALAAAIVPVKTQAQTPANDNFANAQILTSATNVFTATGNNVGATGEPGEQSHGSTYATVSSIWFAWTASANGAIVVDTIGSFTTASHAIYTGTALANLTQISQDSTSSLPSFDKKSVTVTGGTTYYIAVGSRFDQNDRGFISLRLVFSTSPSITGQPSDRIAEAGDNVAFSVSASGSALAYQWFRNGIALSGATAATLSIANVQTTDGGIYYVVVSNAAGSVISTSVVLRGASPQPTFTAQPASRVATAGDTIVLSAAAAGTGPLQYQWRRNGLPIPGATAATLTFAPVSRSDIDLYDVRVNDGLSVAYSNRVQLDVQPAATPQGFGLDSGFNVSLETEGGSVSRLRRAPDGKILIAGNFLHYDGATKPNLSRLNADGSVDPTFVGATFDATVSDVAVQPDGKLIVVGSFTLLDNLSRTGVARLYADGTPDATFILEPTLSFRAVTTVVLQSDGKILVGGDFTATSGAGARSHLMRLLPDGTLDSAFNPGPNGATSSLALQSDGKLLVAGSFTSITGIARRYLTRLNSDGTNDPGFDPGTGPNGATNVVKLADDGRVLISGSFNQFNGSSAPGLLRLRSDGTRDPTFSGLSSAGSIGDFALLSDGRILIAGSFQSVNGVFIYGFARLNLDGSPDITFAADQLVAGVGSVLLLDDGRVLLGGNFPKFFRTKQIGGIAAFSSAGKLDASIRGTLAAGSASALAPLAGGKFLVGGTFSRVNGIARSSLARLNADGSLDPAFAALPNDSVTYLAVQGDGRIVVTGSFTSVGNVSREGVARLNSDGSLDTSFNSRDISITSTGSAPRVASLPEGRVLLAGDSLSSFGLNRRTFARLHADGPLDAGFVPFTDASAGSFFLSDFAVLPDERILYSNDGTLSSSSTGKPAVVGGLATDGRIDPAFTPGVVTASGAGVLGLGLLPDGKILIGGSFTSYNGATRNRIARLLPDGTVDPAFVPSLSSTNNVSRLLPARDGAVYVFRRGITSGSEAPLAKALTRLTAALVEDTSFVMSFTATSTTFPAVVLLDDGNLLIAGGDFREGSTVRSGLARTRAISGAVILTQPSATTAMAGANVTLSVSVGGVLNATYQWFKDGAPIDGAVQSTYVILTAQADAAGSYFVRISYAGGRIDSTPAGLTLNASAPVFSSGQPVPVGLGSTMQAGTRYALVAPALSAGSAPLRYQWSKDGIPLPGETGPSLFRGAWTPGDTGTYRVTISNSLGTITSGALFQSVADTANWTWVSPLPQGNSLTFVQYLDGIFLASGQRGTILRSTDGVSWTLHRAAGSAAVGPFAYGNGKYVALTSFGGMLTSVDGATWTSGESGLTDGRSLAQLAFGGKKFVAVGSLGTVLVSPDGNSWASASIPTSDALVGIAYGAGRWLALSSRNQIFSSTDGAVWTFCAGVPETVNTLAYGAGVFAAISSGTSAAYTSPDGVTWTRHPYTATNAAGIINLQSTPAGFLAPFLSSLGRYLSSTDGIVWTERATDFSLTNLPVSATFGNGRYVMAAGAPDLLLTSPDGNKWTRVGRAESREFRAIAASDDVAVAVGVGQPGIGTATGGLVYSSNDGANWTARSLATTATLNDVAYGVAPASAFVAVGAIGTIASSVAGDVWTLRSSGTSQTLHGVKQIDGRFLAVGDGGMMLSSTDGTSWAPIAAATAQALYQVSYGANVYVVVGAGGTIMTSSDALVWTPRTSGTAATLVDVVYAAEKFVAVASTGEIVTSANGLVWTPAASSAEALSGVAFADGRFLAFGPGSSYYVSTDGLAWSPAQHGSANALNAAVEYKSLVLGVGRTGSILAQSVTLRPGESVPTIVVQPTSQTVNVGQSVTFSVTAAGAPSLSYQWLKNAAQISGANNATFTIASDQPSDAGSYSVICTNATGQVTSEAAVLGVATARKVVGAGTEIGSDIYVDANKNTFDQVLLQGAAATITADLNQITRISYLDLTDDIVQVEFSGAGTLSLVLDNATGPALPASYNQATLYMKGHAGIVITGADDTTNVGVFSVGRITALNQALFRSDVIYDGIADIAFLAILSTNGKFGGVRSANASYFATKGYTGVYAPGVQFGGPVFVGDINASEAATPVLMIGSSPDTRITGGDLLQANGQPVKVSGLTQLKFVAGTTSQGTVLPAQTNKAVLQQNGTDVTAQVVVNPSP